MKAATTSRISIQGASKPPITDHIVLYIAGTLPKQYRNFSDAPRGPTPLMLAARDIVLIERMNE